MCERSFKLWLFCELAERKLYSSYILIPKERRKKGTIENLYFLLCCFAVFFSRAIKRCRVRVCYQKSQTGQREIYVAFCFHLESIKLVEAFFFVSFTIELIKCVYRMQSVYLWVATMICVLWMVVPVFEVNYIFSKYNTLAHTHRHNDLFMAGKNGPEKGAKCVDWWIHHFPMNSHNFLFFYSLSDQHWSRSSSDTLRMFCYYCCAMCIFTRIRIRIHIVFSTFIFQLYLCFALNELRLKHIRNKTWWIVEIVR